MQQRLLSLLAVCGSLAAAERWELKYFHDEDKSALTIVDLKFASPLRGVAIGQLSERGGLKPVALVTSDGGNTWSPVALKEPGISVFFLNESLGWMVTDRNIWVTEEAGRSWRKLKAPSGLRSVYFQDEKTGWAAGIKRQVYVTHDGGEKWEKLPEVEKLTTKPEYTVFHTIDFASPGIGMIAGWSRAPRRDDERQLPDWMDPESAVARRQWPSVSIVLETRDGGKSWSPSTSSVFGRISQLRLSPEGFGFALLEYDETFAYPSELLFVTWRNGKSSSVYRDKQRRITDVGLGGVKGPIYIAGIEQAGLLTQTPIPGKVKILKSTDGVKFTDMLVDYRATARRVHLAVINGKTAWAATDSGMILKLAP
jgi:hypothetical protein